jgi:hypothetical protein
MKARNLAFLSDLGDNRPITQQPMIDQHLLRRIED